MGIFKLESQEFFFAMIVYFVISKTTKTMPWFLTGLN